MGSIILNIDVFVISVPAIEVLQPQLFGETSDILATIYTICAIDSSLVIGYQFVMSCLLTLSLHYHNIIYIPEDLANLRIFAVLTQSALIG